jgi:hypothetical protein
LPRLYAKENLVRGNLPAKGCSRDPFQELYAKENLVRESARKRMFKRSIPRTVCKGEPGERIHTQKNVREIIHYQELMQRRRTWCKNSIHKRMMVQEIHDQELALQSITNNAYIH